MSDEKKKPTIEITENGPLIVKGLDDFQNSRGDSIETKPVLALCRCGASDNKPFCDGTHANIGFTGQKLSKGKWDFRENYVGKKITIHDNREVCCHAGFCTGRLPSVWKSGVEPWIDADGDEVDKVIETIKMCPSGALSYSVEDVEHRDQERDPAIRVTKDGQYNIMGGIELIDIDFGKEVSKEHYALCRCGWSKNKPFCDGSHWYAKFVDDEVHTIPQSEESEDAKKETVWYRVAGLDELPEGRVKTVVAGNETLALTHIDGEYGALNNSCSHQGGPLGEGTIENGCLRCPWHGWDFDPLSGESITQPDSPVSTYPIEVRADGIYVAVEEIKFHTPTVSDVMVETMVNWGVTHVFGMVGHSNLGLADALRLQEENGTLNYIGVRHEGAASFACSGYAKVSGVPAACLSIAGPGATNLLTGLWDAKMDRVPILALTGQVNTQVLGPGAFQEVNLASAFDSVAEWSQTVLHGSHHAELMSLALKHAVIKRDVAHLIFPDEVQVLAAPDSSSAGNPKGRIGPVEITPPESSVDEAIALIKAAERPAIVVGYGARENMDSIIKIAETLDAPVLTTFKAKGQISDQHPNAAGVLGRSGTPIASWCMNESDLLLVFGASFSDHTGIERAKPIIQIDFDRMALGKFHPVTVPVWGEIGITADLILKKLPKKLAAINQTSDIAERWQIWREEKQKRANEDRSKGINSAALFAVLTQVAPANAVISVDVGNNTYSFGRYFECENQTIIMSGYLGSIGFGFPAAMGAWAAAPERPIMSISGDGGFGQYLGEFTTAVKYNMNITHILLNNNEIAKISKEQRAGHFDVWQTSLHNPNFAEFAKSCGGLGIRVSEVGALENAIKEALNYEGPAIVEVMTDSELI
jgi:thiamine pyrophosphate-dependent acetolactate synthase large subunit-like protein/CDGSH-type Zn-finger protein/nitrite reductase/ring-hydroxylating ferredoxin subunit